MIHRDCEKRVRAFRTERRDHEALELVVRTYGSEIGGWLSRILGSDSATSEAYSVFLEDLWGGLREFRGESSLRTWLYRVARNAAMRTLRTNSRYNKRIVSDSEALDVPACRSETAPWLRSAVSLELNRIIQSLDPEDHMILILRIDRRMSWEEISQVVLNESADARQGSAAHQAAIRQRFGRMRRRLRNLATRHGLLPKA